MRSIFTKIKNLKQIKRIQKRKGKRKRNTKIQIKRTKIFTLCTKDIKAQWEWELIKVHW